MFTGHRRPPETAIIPELAPRASITPEADKSLPGFVVETWFGLYGPAHLPATIRQADAAAAQATLNDPVLRERLLSLGAEARPGGPEVLERVAIADRERWIRLVHEQDIRVSD